MSYSPRQTTENPLLLIGTYTEPDESKSEGIYVYRMEPSSGELASEGVIKGIPNVSYMTLHPPSGLIFAVSETEEFNGEPGGGVTVLSRDSDRNLQVIDQRSSGGANPAYISIDHSGRFALVANYQSGNIVILPVGTDGHLSPPSQIIQHVELGIRPERYNGLHPHCIVPDPTNRFVLAADLGADKIFIYHLDLTEGQLHNHTEVEVEARTGPRHILFDSSGYRMYLINELNSTIFLYNYDPGTGTLKQRQTASTLPELFSEPNLCGDFHFSPDEKHLYVSNRGHDSIVCFQIDPNNGELVYQSHVSSEGKGPRSFALDPSGQFIVAAHRKSHTVAVYKIDPDSGDLSYTGYQTHMDMPVHVLFV